MTPLWTAADAAFATGGTTTGDAGMRVSRLTRTLQPDDLFVILLPHATGTIRETGAGRQYSRIGHLPPDGVADDAPLLIVADVLHALGRWVPQPHTWARVGRDRLGKTSTKNAARCAGHWTHPRGRGVL
jgi:UDP-N-acetylmuramoyl-tripeptide--D-alanyl-D-alanine ligase